jgi:hypothetical protein
MSFETTGRIVEVYPTSNISDKFRKREFVIEQSETRNGYEFKEFVKFQLTQDKCALADQYKTGDVVKVSFNLRGRKWEKDGSVNYFTNLEAWKIESASSRPSAGDVQDPFPDISQAPIQGTAETATTEELDDLPF